MSSVTLTILGDASGARRAIADTRAEYERAATALGGVDRRARAQRSRIEAEEIQDTRRALRAAHNDRVRAMQGRRRVEAEGAKQRDRDRKAEAARRKRGEAEEIQDTRRTLASIYRARQKAASDKKKLDDKAAKDAKKTADKEASDHQKAERKKTRDTEREERARTRLSEVEARKRQRQREAYDMRVFRRSMREQRRGERESERNTARRYDRVGGAIHAVGGAALGVASDVHGQIQSARRTAAQRETELDTALIQTDVGSITELASNRAEIMRQIREARLDPDVVIPAISTAQSFANALGGNTARRRRTAINQTMADVRFASDIDPNNVSGLVRLGALARRTMNDSDRQTLLRGAAGISFEGSAETDQMITQGLRGLQEAWSVGTANVTDPEQASRIRAEIARDFMAQVQSAAASGVSVNVSANRTNTIRTALHNDDRQNRLGAAFARRRRTMTPEQQAAFSQAFFQDAQGRYHMAEAVSGRANAAARFFGTMFGNDATAMRNFMGPRGAGGRRQLMNVADVNELATYFGTTTNSRGQQVRQYDYVDELARSAITPAREKLISGVRKSEDARSLNAEENARVQALTENTGAIRQLSDRFAAWQAQHPVANSVVGGAGSVVSSLVTGAFIGRMMRGGANGGRAAGARVASRVLPVLSRALPTGGAAASLGTWGMGILGMLGAGSATYSMASGETLRGEKVSTLGRAARLLLPGAVGSLLGLADLHRSDEGPGSGGTSEPSQVRIDPSTPVLVRIDPSTPLVARIDPHDAAHVASQGAGGRNQRPGGAR